jgi:hypothetical protein
MIEQYPKDGYLDLYQIDKLVSLFHAEGIILNNNKKVLKFNPIVNNIQFNIKYYYMYDNKTIKVSSIISSSSKIKSIDGCKTIDKIVDKL